MAKVAVVMGSVSDLDVVKGAIEILDKFKVNNEVRVLSAHRTPYDVHEFATKAKVNGFDVIIACAGKAAHLAGVIASNTTLPVIGLPIKSSTLDGLDSLLSTVQMPNGIPVATVGINAAVNAALLAIEILAIKDKTLVKKLDDYKKDMKKKILKDDAEVLNKIKK